MPPVPDGNPIGPTTPPSEEPALSLKSPHAPATGPHQLLQRMQQEGALTQYQAHLLSGGQGQSLIVGPYLLLEPLGKGGMGEVFRTRHHLLEREAALKLIRQDHRASPDMVARFLREARAVSALNHPNIVSVYEAGQDGDTLYLAMELLPGVDLSRYLVQQGSLDVAEVCDLIRQAALGLQHVHEKGLVHRDVKPHNLMRTPEGVVKILDLGLARLGSASTLTHLPGWMGTADYIAPEQVVSAHTVDCRADVYSLGCTLYHLLAGRTPFADARSDLVASCHVVSEPPPVEDFRPGLPRKLVAVLRRMMAKKREQRYQTPGEVAAALEPFCRPGASARKAVGGGQPVRRPSRSTSRTPAPPPRPATEPLKLEVTVPGRWLVLEEREKGWTEAGSTPGTVVLEAGKVYGLTVDRSATDTHLAGLQPLRDLPAFQRLELVGCGNLTDAGLVHIRGFTALRRLDLSECQQLTDVGLAHARDLSSLRSLSLRGWNLTEMGLTFVGALNPLVKLDLSSCSMPQDGLSNLGGLTSLRDLDLSRNKWLTDTGLTPLGNLSRLCVLDLGECENIRKAELARHTTLQQLNLSHCWRLATLVLPQSSTLQSLNLRGCSFLTANKLTALRGLTALQKLDLSDCDRLTDEKVSNLRGLTSLESLALASCAGLTDDALIHLGDLSALQSLDASGCSWRDSGLPYLSRLSALQNLNLSSCQQLTDKGVASLRQLRALRHHDLSGCKLSGAGLAHLSGLSTLQALDLSQCPHLKDPVLTLLADLTGLRRLNLSHSRWLTETGLTHLGRLTQLRSLNVAGCPNLTNQVLEALREALPTCTILS